VLHNSEPCHVVTVNVFCWVLSWPSHRTPLDFLPFLVISFCKVRASNSHGNFSRQHQMTELSVIFQSNGTNQRRRNGGGDGGARPSNVGASESRPILCESIFSPPAIFSHIFACCSLNFHSLSLCCLQCVHTIKTSHSVGTTGRILRNKLTKHIPSENFENRVTQLMHRPTLIKSSPLQCQNRSDASGTNRDADVEHHVRVHASCCRRLPYSVTYLQVCYGSRLSILYEMTSLLVT